MRIESSGLHARQAEGASLAPRPVVAAQAPPAVGEEALAAKGPEGLYAVWAPPGSEAARAEALADKLNQQLRLMGEDLHFKIHEGTGRVVVQVVDERTHEVTQELPPEKLLDILASISEATGLRLDRIS